MIVCPNCNHSNPDGAQACEACYTPLPATINCPNCGTPVQTDASFCGQCGYNLLPNAAKEMEATVAPDIPSGIPNSVSPNASGQMESMVASTQVSSPHASQPNVSPTAVSAPNELEQSEEMGVPLPPPPIASTPATSEEAATAPVPPPAAISRTQLQQQTAKLLHVQTDTVIELPQNLSVIHIGKANDRIPPDVDVSGFPHSEVVSRIHADIRLEGDTYYIEDVGSSNGTYINNLPLAPGNRHRLRAGDRIALGKGDLVTLIFQLS